jgi:hypothetical protein
MTIGLRTVSHPGLRLVKTCAIATIGEGDVGLATLRSLLCFQSGQSRIRFFPKLRCPLSTLLLQDALMTIGNRCK